MTRRIKRGWMPLRVDDVRRESSDAVTLVMVDDESGDCAFDYLAGQYLTFRFDEVSEKPVVRSYTMSSSPCQPDAIEVTVKKTDGGFISHHLVDRVKSGDVLRARGPIGRFGYHEGKDQPHLVMVAAGSGVTPFVSLLRQYTQVPTAEGPQRMTLIVSYRTREDLLCWETLQAAAQHPAVRLEVALSREEAEGFHHGRIDEAMLARLLPDAAGSTWLTCGPQPLMDLVVAYARERGVPEEHARTESFES